MSEEITPYKNKRAHETVDYNETTEGEDASVVTPAVKKSTLKRRLNIDESKLKVYNMEEENKALVKSTADKRPESAGEEDDDNSMAVTEISMSKFMEFFKKLEKNLVNVISSDVLKDRPVNTLSSGNVGLSFDGTVVYLYRKGVNKEPSKLLFSAEAEPAQSKICIGVVVDFSSLVVHDHAHYRMTPNFQVLMPADTYVKGQEEVTKTGLTLGKKYYPHDMIHRSHHQLIEVTAYSTDPMMIGCKVRINQHRTVGWVVEKSKETSNEKGAFDEPKHGINNSAATIKMSEESPVNTTFCIYTNYVDFLHSVRLNMLWDPIHPFFPWRKENSMYLVPLFKETDKTPLFGQTIISDVGFSLKQTEGAVKTNYIKANVGGYFAFPPVGKKDPQVAMVDIQISFFGTNTYLYGATNPANHEELDKFFVNPSYNDFRAYAICFLKEKQTLNCMYNQNHREGVIPDKFGLILYGTFICNNISQTIQRYGIPVTDKFVSSIFSKIKNPTDCPPFFNKTTNPPNNLPSEKISSLIYLNEQKKTEVTSILRQKPDLYVVFSGRIFTIKVLEKLREEYNDVFDFDEETGRMIISPSASTDKITNAMKKLADIINDTNEMEMYGRHIHIYAIKPLEPFEAPEQMTPAKWFEEYKKISNILRVVYQKEKMIQDEIDDEEEHAIASSSAADPTTTNGTNPGGVSGEPDHDVVEPITADDVNYVEKMDVLD